MQTIQEYLCARDVSRRSFVKKGGFLALGSLGLVATGTLASLTGCAPAQNNPDDAPDALKDKVSNAAETLGDGKTLRVGMEAAYAPYNWQVSAPSTTTIPIENVAGAYADGYDVAITMRLAEFFHMKAVAVKMSFSGLIDAVNNGQIDLIIAGMSDTPERAQSIDFSKSYLDDSVTLVVKKDSKFAQAKTLEDLSGAVVLGQQDTLFDEIIDQIPGVQHLTPVNAVPAMIDRLNQQTCDAITFSKLSLPQLLETNPNFMELQLSEGFHDNIMQNNIGLKKGQDAVRSRINEFLDGISADERQKLWLEAMDRQPA